MNKLMIVAIIMGVAGFAHAETATEQLGVAQNTVAAVNPSALQTKIENDYAALAAKFTTGKRFTQEDLEEYQTNKDDTKDMIGTFIAESKSDNSKYTSMIKGEIKLNIWQKLEATNLPKFPLMNINGHYFNIGLAQTEDADGVFTFSVSLSNANRYFTYMLRNNSGIGDDLATATLISGDETMILVFRKYENELVGSILWNSATTYPESNDKKATSESLNGYFSIPLKD